MKTKFIYSKHAIIAAMSAPCPSLRSPPSRRWISTSNNHDTFIRNYASTLQDLKFLPPIKSLCEVSEKSVSLRSLMRLNIEWLREGKDCSLKVGDGIELRSGFKVFSKNVVAIKTRVKNNYVYLIRGDMNVKTVMMAHWYCTQILKGFSHVSFVENEYSVLRFPKVRFKVNSDAPEVEGMKIKTKEGEKVSVVKCRQLFDFGMDTAVGGTAKLESKTGKKIFKIDEPFALFMVNSNIAEPYLVAQFI